MSFMKSLQDHVSSFKRVIVKSEGWKTLQYESLIREKSRGGRNDEACEFFVCLICLHELRQARLESRKKQGGSVGCASELRND